MLTDISYASIFTPPIREQTWIISDPVDFPKFYRFLCNIAAYQQAMLPEMLDSLVPGFVLLV
jgi:hypothetical protein